MLDVFPVFLNQGGSKLDKMRAQLRDEFCSYKVLDGLFGGRIRIDIYVKLCGVSIAPVQSRNVEGEQ